MTHAYILEHAEEADRLERQALLPAYDIEQDIASVQLEDGQKLLDMGCGSGVACRYLARRFPDARIEGCDASSQRLEQASSFIAEGGDIRFFQSRLEQIDAIDGTYDFAMTRFVLEHVHDPLACLKEAFRVLKPGGTLLAIDFDGLMFNLFPMNPALAAMRDRLIRAVPVNFYIGREIPSLMIAAGFESISWDIEAHAFTGQALEEERALCADRIAFARPAVAQILREQQADVFAREYMAHLDADGAVLFYNKFRVTGRRPL